MYDIIWLKRDDWDNRENDKMPDFPPGLIVRVSQPLLKYYNLGAVTGRRCHTISGFMPQYVTRYMWLN